METAHSLLHRTARGPSLMPHPPPKSEAHPLSPPQPQPQPRPPQPVPVSGGSGGIEPSYSIQRGDQFRGQQPPPPPPSMRRPEERGRGGGGPSEGDFRMRVSSSK